MKLETSILLMQLSPNTHPQLLVYETQLKFLYTSAVTSLLCYAGPAGPTVMNDVKRFLGVKKSCRVMTLSKEVPSEIC